MFVAESHPLTILPVLRFQSVKYSLRCLVATSPNSECVNRIRETEARLDDKKRHLETFQSEFCDIKKKYEEACEKLGKDIIETQVSNKDCLRPALHVANIQASKNTTI